MHGINEAVMILVYFSRFVGVLAAGLLLAGCEGRVSVDLASDAPADPDIARVQVPLLGLEFSKTDGSTETLEFEDTEFVDLMDLLEGDPLRVFTDEELPEGTYDGVRLLFDTDEEGVVTLSDGGEFPIVIVDGEYAPVDITVEDSDSSDASDSSLSSDSSTEEYTLSVDLRQSLSFDDDDDEYTFTANLRSVRSEEAAQLSGNVTVDCPSGSSFEEGGAVYLFEGQDEDAVDRDGDTGPYATTGLQIDAQSGAASYVLRFLPAGDYTVAATCNGDADDPDTDDDIAFEGSDNIELDEEESLEFDIE